MKPIYRILSVFLILAIMTSIVSFAKQEQPNKPIVDNMDQVTKLIPQAKPPQGFTEDQIQKAKEVTVKDIEKITKNLSVQQSQPSNYVSAVQYYDAMYIVKSQIDDQYTVFSYNTCNQYCYIVHPDLKIPIKTEIWDNNFNPKSGAYISNTLYFWNYYTNRWTWLSLNERYTDTNGISRYGISIPYRYYSDKYYLTQYSHYWDGSRWQTQYSQNFFTVNWY